MAYDDLPYRFHWTISNLLAPWRGSAATFYIKTPTLTQWEAFFQPRGRYPPHWPFEFSLRNVILDERYDDTVADQMWVIVSVNETVVARRRRRNYSFSAANQYTFEFAGNLWVPSTEVSHHVTIEVQISFPHRNIVNPRYELHTALRVYHLEQLSHDLGSLLASTRYSNLKLISRGPNGRTYNVHSYIIRARWSNFFSVHPAQTIIDDTVEVNISNYILQQVLRYVYSGTLDTNAILGNRRLKTELFQVIDRYKMHQLYNVFVMDDSRQVRETTKHLRTYAESFRLDGLNWNECSITRILNVEAGYRLFFQIRFLLSGDVPSLYYSLFSEFPYRLYLHVKLELESKPEGNGSTFSTLHGSYNTIDSSESIRSEIHRINGLVGGGEERIEHFIHYTLYLSDGSAVIRIQSEGGNQVLGFLERYRVLSDDMYELYTKPAGSDFHVSSPLDRPELPYHIYAPFYLHKGVFNARVPHWKGILENVTEESVIPDRATCIMLCDAFDFFAAYIYSGKLFPVLPRYLEEIHDFADRAALRYLRAFARTRIRAVRRL